MPLLIVGLWLWGPRRQLTSQRVLVGLLSCLFAQIFWQLWGKPLLSSLYRALFAFPVSKGRVRNSYHFMGLIFQALAPTRNQAAQNFIATQ
ncbi:UDP-diphosphatase [Erwinia pyrifoliae]|uniref:UDP-diphosphatase n=1 Tax=Erwinia pyrifoliae TaxID=79967 RepID=UPI0035CCFE1E